MIKIALSFLLFSAINSACAGGSEWSYFVSRLDQHGDNYELILNAVDRKDNFMGCRELIIDGSYATLKWMFFGGSNLSIDRHRAALGYLMKSQAERKVVRVGAMGEGLSAVKDRPCRFKSLGLALIVSEEDFIVWSFSKWP